MADDFQAMRVRVSGRVQGVSFREWTRRQADLLDVSGWVRNEPDGSVVALLAGTESAVSAMIERLWEGPVLAVVTDVKAEPVGTDERPAGFRVLHS
jgi:acylphosphatase